MIEISGARKRRVSLVLRLCDILTGETIIGGRDISVMSGDGLLAPVVKPDGYFVFTDRRPDSVSVKSGTYRSEIIVTDGQIGAVLRFALIPKTAQGRGVTVPEGAYAGFGGSGYFLAEEINKDSTSICLRKEDFRDVTDLYHVLVTPDGAAEAVYLEKNLGAGRYSLYMPPKNTYQVRTTRIIALHKTSGGRIPVPSGTDTVYIMSDGVVKTVSP